MCQIHADRVVGELRQLVGEQLFAVAVLRSIEVNRGTRLTVVAELNAKSIDQFENDFHLTGVARFIGQEVVCLFVGEIALRFG